MENNGTFFNRALRLYIDGFRNMTIGRSLWIIIAVKIVVMFAILKVFFFPDLLKRDYNNDDERAAAVRGVLIERTVKR